MSYKGLYTTGSYFLSKFCYLSITSIMKVFNKLPKFTKSFYFLSGMVFLSWMLFFDSNDIYSQFMLKRKVTNLESEKAYYLDKIEQVKNDKEALLNDKELLERFAREKYFLKNEGEDLFIIVEED